MGGNATTAQSYRRDYTTNPTALGLGWGDTLRVPLLSEHSFREVQALLDIGEPSLHVLEVAESCLNPFQAAELSLQVLDRLCQLASGGLPAAESVGGQKPPHHELSDRDGQDDEADAHGPFGDAKHVENISSIAWPNPQALPSVFFYPTL